MSNDLVELLKQDLMGRGLLMEITSDNSILGKFICNAIEEIYIKYSSITKEEEQLVTRFAELIKEFQIDFNPYQDYEQTKELAVALADEENADIVKLYLVLTLELDLQLDLADVKVRYKDLEGKGYVQVDKYLFFYNYGEDHLQAMAEETLAERLEDVDYILDSFDSEEVAYMWLFATPMEEAASQIILDHGWLEALNLVDLGTAYWDQHDSKVSICVNNDEYLFR